MAAMKKEPSFLDGLTDRLSKKSTAIARLREEMRNRIGLNAAERKEREKKAFIEKSVRNLVANQRLRGGLGGSHYGESLNTEHMIDWADAVAQSIITGFGEDGTHYPVLLYRGMSGIVAATHLSAAMYRAEIEHGMGYVRKDNENSHGSAVERTNLPDHTQFKVVFIFCDDFICGGDTMRETLKKFQLHMRFRLHVDQIWTALSDAQKYIRPAKASISSLQKDLDEGWNEVMKAHEAAALSEWEHKEWIEEREAAAEKERKERESVGLATRQFIKGTGVSVNPPVSLQNDADLLFDFDPVTLSYSAV